MFLIGPSLSSFRSNSFSISLCFHRTDGSGRLIVDVFTNDQLPVHRNPLVTAPRVGKTGPIIVLRGIIDTDRCRGRLIRFADSRRTYARAGLSAPLITVACCAPAGVNQLAHRAPPFQRFTSLRLCLMHHYVFDYGRLVASVTSSLSSATRRGYVKAGRDT